jgi:polysaccharide biosynthesis transport protein
MEAKQADVDQQRKAATDPAEQERLDTLALQYKQLYASLMTSYEQARLAEIQASANIVQVYQAAPGTEPVSPKIIQNTIIAALIGLLLAALAVFGLDALDDTLKTPEEVSTALNLPVLGVIFQHKIKLQPVALEEPRSPVAEAFRTLRTNIQYANVDEPLRTLLITSPLPGEGKTTISANLAVVFAHAGKRVYYADADLRHPTVHKKFGIPNNSGLTQLILDPDLPVAQFSQNGKVPGLHVVTCGDLPPNPAELLGSKKMATLLDKFKSESDLVILDSPPVLAVSDPAVLAPSVDGVILVLRPGKTTRRAALQAIDALRQVAAPLIGVVLNDVHTNGHSYSYYYRHGYYPHKYKYYGKNEGKSSK